MPARSIPFAPYDFFGYLASGFALLVGCQLIADVPPVLGHQHTPMELALLVFGAYLVGHLVAAAAKPVLEDWFVHRVLRPPSHNLVTRRSTVWRWICPGYFKVLPVKSIERIRALAPGMNGETLFLAVRFDSRITSNAVTMARLDTFLAQYGFARNIAFSLLLLTPTFLIAARVTHKPDLPIYATLCAVGGLGFLYRYLKFFRQYSYELLNSFAGLAVSK
jgi:hypothetical protein